MDVIKKRPHTGSGYPSPAIGWITVLVLSLTYMFSFMDRQILVLLVEPMKQDLQISDTQVSLLTGFAFAAVYAVMGIPMGRAADLRVRKHVIIFGVTIWSVLTIYCGLARNFIQLFFARMGVGFGEAALTPTAYSMVADLFPPEKLSRAMSVFVLGGTAGAALSLLFGGYVIGWVDQVGEISLPLLGVVAAWQLVLIIVGFLSLLMVIPLSLIPEPARHNTCVKGSPEGETNLSFSEVLAYLWTQKRFYGFYIAGIALFNLYAYGGGAWLPSYFIRVHGWEASSAGINLGLLYLVPALFGSLFAGWLSDRLFARGFSTASLSLMTIAVAMLTVLIPLVIYIPSMPIKIVAMVLANLLVVIVAVLLPTVMQLATPNRIRAQVSAIFLLVINLVGIGLGPTVIALITDYGFQDDMAVGDSIALVAVTCFLLATALLLAAHRPFQQRVNEVIYDKT
jgi:MFS family permease